MRRSLTAFLLVLGFSPAMAADSNWHAWSGSLPDLVCPPWSAGGTGGAVPAIIDGALRLDTESCPSNRYYLQAGGDILMPDSVVFEARLRFGGGSQCANVCGPFRRPAAISITTAPNVGSLVFVGQDVILLTSNECGTALTAGVPTMDAFHTYKVTIRSGTTRVYYDGALVMTSSTYFSAADHSPAPRILWGEGSSLAQGTSDWEFVKHNAHSDGCSSTGVETESGGVLAARPIAFPNPSHSTTEIEYVLPRAASVRVEVFDASGRAVRRLFEGMADEGRNRVVWDGKDGQGRPSGPGAYFVRVASGDAVQTGLLTRVR